MTRLRALIKSVAHDIVARTASLKEAASVDRTRAALRRFRDDRRGNVALIFGLAAIPIVAAIGSAVDYSHAITVRTSMQAALDATVLALSKDAQFLTTAQLSQKATDYFNQQFHNPGAKDVSVQVTYSTTSGPKIVATASGIVDYSFMRLVGVSESTLSVESETIWSTARLRVALALDTTGSMADAGKIDALKTATKNLLTQLKTAAQQNGDVYVSIVPFSKNVNVNPSNYSASWVDWADWEAEPQVMSNWISNNSSTWEQVGPGSNCPFTNNSHGFRCFASPVSTTIASTVPSSGTYSGYICPSTDNGNVNANKIGLMYNGCYTSTQATRSIATGSNASCGTKVNCSCSGSGKNKKCTQTYYTHAFVKKAHNTWNGCVTDRGTSTGPSSDYDRLTTAPGGSAASKFPAEQNAYCSPAAMGLSYSWDDMNTLVDNLYPSGATNQPIGLVWGWQSLVGGGPFTVPAKDSRYQYQDVIVLMSDGLNTQNRWYGNGSTTNTSVDARMYQSATVGTCANIKATGALIYTLHLNTDGQTPSALLKNCATDADKFLLVTSSAGLIDAFKTIGANLTKLRLTN